jgi:hypothetical protein
MTGEWSGVWVSNVPLDGNEGAVGDFLLELEIPAKVFEKREWFPCRRPCYRKISARLAAKHSSRRPPWNPHLGTIRLIDEDEEIDMYDEETP